MRQKLIDEFNIQPSIMSIHRYIKSFNYTLKRTTSIPERRNDGKTIDATHLKILHDQPYPLLCQIIK